MISVETALSLVLSEAKKRFSKVIPLSEASGKILSDAIYSKIDMPPFRQSAMDGYALSLHEKNIYEIISEVKAGDDINITLEPGQGVRIFTGAVVPDTANTVIMQEKVQVNQKNITLAENPIKNQNIRKQGEQILKDGLALTEGSYLSPAAIGFLSGLGITEVPVYAAPKVAIITTGNELIKPGNPLPKGKIYESNSLQLEMLLKETGVTTIEKIVVPDNLDQTISCIEKAQKENDILLISGGISVGDYDFVQEALNSLGYKEIFYKIKQKPGKPLYFGKNKTTSVFALPGNPASSLTCFYIYTFPFIKKIMGFVKAELPRKKLETTSAFEKKGDRAQFLKAKVSNDQVEILGSQSSAMLNSFAVANALVYLPEDSSHISKGEKVETILLPYSH